MRTIQGLLSLCQKYEANQINQACDKAWRSKSFNYRVIKTLLEKESATTQQTMEFMDDHPVIRSTSEYSDFVKRAIQGDNAMSVGMTTMLKKLRLSGLGDSLEVRLHEAASRGLSHRDFLEMILQDELMVRNSRTISRRVTSACFRDNKRLEDFDFTFNPTIKKNRIYDLATCQFIRDKRDVLWLGRLELVKVI